MERKKKPASHLKKPMHGAHSLFTSNAFADVHLKPSIFISYSRGDDETFVHKLFDDLEEHGYTVWFDRKSMPARQLTFHQEIRDAVASHDRLVLILGPKAVESDYVIQEWRYAYEMDKPIKCILRKGDESLVPEELKLIDYSDFLEDLKYDDNFKTLDRQLSEPPPPLGKLIGVPSLPPHILQHSDRIRALRDVVLVDLNRPVVVTGASTHTGIYGMGGIGKSVLANLLARDRKIRYAFPDGVLWLSIGQQPDINELLRHAITELGGDGRFTSILEGRQKLENLLASKAILILLDDVWENKHTEPFDNPGARCRMIVTTRNASIITALGGTQYRVELLTDEEALQLLSKWTEKPLASFPDTAKLVIKECGRLPLAVAICGAMVRDGLNWNDLLEALQEADLKYLDHPHGNILKSIKVSIDQLEPELVSRFAELSVFPPDETVPEVAVQTFWNYTGKLTPRHTIRIFTILEKRSLLQINKDRLNPDNTSLWRISMHDLLYDYASSLAGDRMTLHQMLLDAYRIKCFNGWHSGPDDGYFFQSVCYHLGEAGKPDEQTELLCDLRFVEARCKIGQVFTLLKDYSKVLRSLPEMQENLKSLGERKERLNQWTTEIIEYSKTFTGGKDQQTQIDNISELKAKFPEIIESCRIWTPEEIDAERRRIMEKPTRMDRLNAFFIFVNSQCYPLIEFGKIPGFVLQHAFNNAPAGLVHLASKELLHSLKVPHVLRRWNKNDIYNPKNALLQTLEGHSDFVQSVSITPDGRRAVSGSVDKTVRLWDIESGECLRILEGHYEKVSCVSITPDGRRAVSGSHDNSLRVWDAESGECICTLKGHNDWVNCVSITPDGSTALSGSKDNTLRVWDIERCECVRILNGHNNSIESISITPDARIGITGSADYLLHVWNIEKGDCICTLEGHRKKVNCVSMTPDGKKAVSGSGDETIREWDIEGGECIRTLEGHGSVVNSVSITPDGRRAISGSMDETLRVWELKNGKCIRTLEGHSDSIQSVSITADGRRAVSGSQDNSLRVWDIESSECLHTGEGHNYQVNCLSVTPDGRRAVSGSMDNTLRAWDIESGEYLHSFVGHGHSVQSVSITANGRTVVSGSWNNTLRVWDIDSEICLRTLEGQSSFIKKCISITPDGRRAISGSENNTLRVWDIESGECIHILEGHISWVPCVSVTPDGRKAVSGSLDHTLRVWDIESGECLRTLKGHSEGVECVSITPDGRKVISASEDMTLRVWEIETGECIRTLEGHNMSVVCVSVTPDGRKAVSGSLDHTVRIWDIESGVCLNRIEGHNNLINCIAFTPDGQGVITGSEDNTLRLWDIERGLCLTAVSANSPIRCNAVNGKGNIIAGFSTGEVKFYELFERPYGNLITTLKRNSNQQFVFSYRCPVCGIESEIGGTITEAVFSYMTSLTPGQSPSIYLPDSAFLDSQLLSTCAKCSGKIRFNPFCLDYEDYEQVLRRGLEICRKNPSQDLKDTIGHLTSLITYLNSCGKIMEAKKVTYERDEFLQTLTQESLLKGENIETSRDEIFHKVLLHIENKNYPQAIFILDEIQEPDSTIENIKGVCYLRIGNFNKALEIFHQLARRDALSWNNEAPFVYKKNFITTLLCLRNIEAFRAAIREIEPEEQDDHIIRKLIETYKSWKKEKENKRKSIPLIKRIFSGSGKDECEQIRLDFEPGELFFSLPSVNKLVGFRQDNSDSGKSETLLREEFATRERILGPEHPDTLTTIIELADLLYSMRDYSSAEILYRRALESNEKVLGSDHPQTLNCMRVLAFTLRVRGKYLYARELYDKIIKLCLRSISENKIDKDVYFDLAVSYNEIAFHYFIPEKKWDDAENYYRNGVKFCKMTDDPIEIANMELNLQTCLHRSGKGADLKQVKELSAILRKADDKRASKGEEILGSLNQT